MALITAGDLSHTFDDRIIFEGASLHISPGARIGVIGRNGTGKSTLLNILAEKLEPSGGRVDRQRGVRVGHQTQELRFQPGATVREELLAVFAEAHDRERELRRLEEQLAGDVDEAEQKRLLVRYEELQQAHQASRTFDVDRRIETVLTSLGLPESAWDQGIDRFSGGERNVIGLARVILSEPDVMLLDEPSNHLDMEGIEWFIEFLKRTPAAVVMVSHNRHLLDETVKRIWEIERCKFASWAGNYSAFKQLKAEALALQERQYKAQRKTIERLEFQARRLRDMANAYDDPGQAKRAKAMMRRIEQMDQVDRPETAERTFKARLSTGERHGRIAVQVKDLTFQYEERLIFDRAELEIEQGDRVCLVGPNGSGKTTLFRQLLEHGSWEHETLRLGKSVRIGEYRQLHDILDHEATLEEWMSRETGLSRSDSARLLHRFLFSRDDLDRRIETLSGGEKSRLQLARLVHHKVNLLLLDEPTNHLDLEACEQLEAMLREFDGTLIIISHDRYFLDKLVDRVVEVKDRKLQTFGGGFAQWWESKQAEREKRRKGALELKSQKDAAQRDKQSARQDHEDKKARQRELRKLRQRLSGLESRIADLEARHEDLKVALADAYGGAVPPHKAEQLNQEFQEVQAEIEKSYAEWEELAASLEAAE
ncbi:MAG: ABC-F family ATP-binding cassette domain-containing protein [Planctomycetota bacterium]